MDVAILGVDPPGRRYARACAAAGFAVTVCDEDANAVLDAVDSLSSDAADGTTGVRSAVDGADVVVETRSFELDTARERLAEVEDGAPADALLAIVVDTATVTSLSVALRDPYRLVGLHDAAPTGGRGPVEVVVADRTDESTVTDAVRFVEQLGLVPLRVRDGPGFASDRLRLALQAEAMRLYDQGVASPGTIDETMTVADGHDIGPLELADRQGLDTVEAALERLAAELGPQFEPPGVLSEKIDAGELGRARGTGFYRWENGDIVGPSDDRGV